VARPDRRALADESSLLANETRRASRTRTASDTRDPSAGERRSRRRGGQQRNPAGAAPQWQLAGRRLTPPGSRP